jgi:hypothetical protein
MHHSDTWTALELNSVLSRKEPVNNSLNCGISLCSAATPVFDTDIDAFALDSFVT